MGAQGRKGTRKRDSRHFFLLPMIPRASRSFFSVAHRSVRETPEEDWSDDENNVRARDLYILDVLVLVELEDVVDEVEERQKKKKKKKKKKKNNNNNNNNNNINNNNKSKSKKNKKKDKNEKINSNNNNNNNNNTLIRRKTGRTRNQYRVVCRLFLSTFLRDTSVSNT